MSMSETEHTPERFPKRSQCQVIGRGHIRTWTDYRQGCLSTYGGGHHTDGHLEAFQQGMQTIFNLLEEEFPPAERCFACVNALAGASDAEIAQVPQLLKAAREYAAIAKATDNS